MIIILEGPDGSGKSTLAKTLAELFRDHAITHRKLLPQLIHTGPPQKGHRSLFRVYQSVLQKAQTFPCVTIFDRLFHGELVYGPAMREKSQITLEQLYHLELQANTTGCFVVWCTADPDDLVKRGDPIYQKVDPDLLLTGYEVVQDHSGLPNLTYDSSREDVKQKAEVIYALTQGPNKGYDLKGVGNRHGVALVGEKLPGTWPAPGHGWQLEPYKAIRPFDTSRSGEYLMRSLRLADVASGEVYLTNAYKQHTDRGDDELMQELKDVTKVVCLGESARRKVGALWDGPIAQVPHPQYWSRFMHHNPGRYAQLLKEAIGD